MDKHGELFVNDGKSYFAYMDGCCVPYSIKNNANGDYPSVSVYDLAVCGHSKQCTGSVWS